MTVRVVRVGGTQAVTTVRIGGATVTGAVLISGIGAVKLDELTDVDGATAAVVGRSLLKNADGVWRPGTVSGSGSAVPHRHDQTLPQAVFPVEHGLGYFPAAVALYSLDLTTQYGQFQVQHVDTDNLLISMDQPTAVTALIL